MVSRDTAPEADENSYELGDLELAPQPVRPSQQQPPARFQKPRDESDEEHDVLPALSTFESSVPANDINTSFDRGARSGAEAFGGGLDDALEGPSLELETLADVPATRSARPQVESARRPSSAHSSSRALAGSGRPQRDQEQAARELAAYGEPPSGFLGAARYVGRVAVRLMSLYRERREVEERASGRAEAYEQSLDALGRALLNDAEVCAHEGLREQVANVEAKQRALAEIEAATRDARAREESALAALKKARSELEAELAPFVAEEQRVALQHEKLEAELKRKQAQVQRAAIELRALAKASLPPPPARVQGIELERQEREAQLLALNVRHGESSAELGRARRELALRRGGLDILERQHEERTARTRALHGRLDADVSLAERALRAALCGLAEAADKLEVPHTAADEIEDVRAREAALDEVVELLTRYDRALSLYDRAALMRGALVWASFALAVLLLIRLA